MRNTTHELVGVACAVAASRTLGLDAFDAGAAAAGAVLGARLPDADRLGARVHRPGRLARRSAALAAAGFVLRLPLLVLAVLLPHRGMSHSLPACVLLSGLAAAVGLAVGGPAAAAAAGAAVGYLSHVLADACTPSGVGLWLPFSRRRVWLLPRRARIATGSVRELLVAVTAAMGVAGLLLT